MLCLGVANFPAGGGVARESERVKVKRGTTCAPVVPRPVHHGHGALARPALFLPIANLLKLRDAQGKVRDKDVSSSLSFFFSLCLRLDSGGRRIAWLARERKKGNEGEGEPLRGVEATTNDGRELEYQSLQEIKGRSGRGSIRPTRRPRTLAHINK